jgi:RsiW-degrading membrane proteinase PrsW (M82 family)
MKFALNRMVSFPKCLNTLILIGRSVLAMNGSTWMILIILFTVAFAPSIAYIIWIRNTEHYEREPWTRIFAVFIWGAVFGVILALLFSYILIFIFGVVAPQGVYSAVEGNEYYYGFLLAVIIAPFAEEAAKGLGVYTAGRDLDEVEDGLIYGAAVGLGFAATENLLYEYNALVTVGVGAFIATAIIRSICSALLHASATSVTGYGIGRRKIWGRMYRVLPFYLLAVGMHALFNFLAIMGTFFSLILAIAFALAAIEFTRHKIAQLDVAHMNRDRYQGLY